MKTVVISYPDFFHGEAEAISAMLVDGTADRVHLRKPLSSEADMARLIAGIPVGLHQRLTLHDHFGLAEKFAVGGLHLNSRNPRPLPGWNGLLSCSLHSPDELRQLAPEFDYAFISPVYPSISKPGYRPDFTIEDLQPWLDSRIYALGGVTADRMPEIEAAGFGGVALLGAIWKAKVDMHSFRLQFISHGDSAQAQLAGMRAVLQGGCRWVQLRMKDAALEQVAAVGREAAALCRSYGATFIVDDHVELADELGADGVHLGRNDMPVEEARRILGPMKIIGATANEFADINKACMAGADYVGLGPYRFTTTKKNLSPVLGLDGYRLITEQCVRSGIRLPIVAIGGITAADLPLLASAGVQGVAASGAILRASDPVAECSEWIGQQEKFNTTKY